MLGKNRKKSPMKTRGHQYSYDAIEKGFPMTSNEVTCVVGTTT